MRPIGLAALVGVSGLLALAVPACGAGNDASCESGDRVFEDGARWTCADGCNECACNDGTVSSTLIGCPDPPGPAANMLSCNEGGMWNRHAASWTCGDGCDLCSCDDGQLSRVERECG